MPILDFPASLEHLEVPPDSVLILIKPTEASSASAIYDQDDRVEVKNYYRSDVREWSTGVAAMVRNYRLEKHTNTDQEHSRDERESESNL